MGPRQTPCRFSVKTGRDLLRRGRRADKARFRILRGRRPGASRAPNPDCLLTMLTSFRSFFKSKIGVVVTLAFLAIIAFAFASMDLASTASFGGVAGDDQVAVVGDEKISAANLSQAASNAVDRVREERDPTISMPAYIAQGGLTEVLDNLIDRFSLRGYAREHGLRAGENLVNSEIRSIPAFRGPDGNFSKDAYDQVLRQQGLSDSQVRQDIAIGLLAQQMLIPASFGSTVPDSIAERYAQLFKERRQGTIAMLPSSAFAPTGAPSTAQLQAFYQQNRGQFIRPERRVVRYATFGSSALGDSIAPTEAEIAARYKRDAAQYAASEKRSFTQLIVPTKAAAESIRQRVAAGTPIEQVAQEAGFRTSPLSEIERAALQGQASKEVAAAYFSAAEGSVTAPARSPLGWHVAEVESVERVGARSLADVRGDIATALREEKRVSGLADLAARVEEQIDEGATLPEIAAELKLAPSSTAPITASGEVYGSADGMAPTVLAPALATAFQMDEGNPELAVVDGGETYLIFEVTDVTPSAVAPLAEIRDAVTEAWRESEGKEAALAAANRVLARLAKGATMAEALAAERESVPSAERIDLTREELARQREERVPPPLALLFSMAQGTSKKLEAANNLGWFVVYLDTIALDTLAEDDPLIAMAKQEIGPLLGTEYAEQLRAAMREEMGVERNPTAIAAVRKQLSGTN